MMKRQEAQPVTHNIANKGFSGMRRLLTRFNFSCNLIGNHPQSLTALTLERYVALKNTR